MEKLNRKQRLYRERVAAGVCAVCGKVPPKLNAKSCQQCLDRTASSRDKDRGKNAKLALKLKRKENGICVYCGNNPSDNNKLGCKECNVYRSHVYTKKLQEKRKNNKLCLRCGSDVRYQRYKICQECRRKELEAKRKLYVEHGLCKTCGAYPIKSNESTLCLRCTDRIKLNKKRRIKERWQLILDNYGRRCSCCGEKEEQFLTIDHVNNDGALHKKILGSKDSDSVRRWVIANNFPSNIQLLCYNCNCAKGKLGYCPHQLNKTIDLNQEHKNLKDI